MLLHKRWLPAVLAVCLLTGCGAGGGAAVTPSDHAAQQAVSAAPKTEAVPVSLSDLSMEIGKGITRRLTAVGGERIQWQSSDPAVASVDGEGNVRALSLGECVISAENEYGSRAECGVTVKKTCYLTIDDGPGVYTQQLLRVLREQNVKATFFVVNNKHIDEVKNIHADGHVIGLHAGVHIFRYCYRSDYGYFCDLAKLNERVRQETGEGSNLMRFPGGTGNTKCELLRMRRLVNGAHDLGYRVFDWTASADEADPGANSSTSVANLLRQSRSDVDILLVHDLSFTPKALEELIPKMRKRGYVFETLDHYPERSFTHTCRYAYSFRDVPAKDVSLSAETLTLPVGGKKQLTAKMTPERSSDYIRWQSSDGRVFTVDPSGLVQAEGEGDAWLFAFTSSNEWATCHITVTPAEEAPDGN